MKLFSQEKSRKRPLEKQASAPSTSSRTTNKQLHEFARSLPVYQFRKELREALTNPSDSRVLIVVAETGSGKSSQIPAYLLDSGHRMAVTQPRRVAAMTLARRVTLEQGCGPVGQGKVGYRVRFEDKTSPSTQLVYMTDGMLLREAMTDPLLGRYSIVFLDEAHERSLQTDILLGIVQKARKARHGTRLNQQLKVVVMSATLQVETFRQFFGGTDDAVQVIQIPGRQFPVRYLHTAQPVDDYLEAALSTILQIIEYEAPGDILAFLPGQEEIEDLASLLRQMLQEEETSQWIGDRVESMQPSGRKKHSNSQLIIKDIMICLLYAALPPEAQLAAFEEKPIGFKRKVVLATTIAETSVTLPDIRYVVDSGKHKCRRVLSSTGMESLTVENISQAQAAQRAGRAGRVQEGLCFRLYTEDAFKTLDEASPPEILRVSLAQVILQLMGMGITDPTTFDFVTPPENVSIIRAMKILYALSALDDGMLLTSHGRQLAKLPLDPVFGHLLLKSQEYGCVKEMLTAVAVLSAENLFYRPPSSYTENSAAAKAAAAHRRFYSLEGDLPAFLNVYEAWQREAVYVPSLSDGRKLSKQSLSERGGSLPSHAEWCMRNYVSGRALARSYHIRDQLETICSRSLEQHGLAIDVTSSCGQNREIFLKCVAAGLFLQAASRIQIGNVELSHGSGRLVSSGSSVRGRYRTKLGNDLVSIHPSSVMFGRQPAAKCVVYTELVTTKRSYIRGVTQIREEWLQEVAPNFYKN